VSIGLDVHRDFFVASCICEGEVKKRCRMPGRAEAVLALVKKEIPGERYWQRMKQAIAASGYTGS
jgi:hypothetical protein